MWLVTQEFTRLHVEITDVRSERTATDRYVVELLAMPAEAGMAPSDGLLKHITAIPTSSSSTRRADPPGADALLRGFDNSIGVAITHQRRL